MWSNQFFFQNLSAIELLQSARVLAVEGRQVTDASSAAAVAAIADMPGDITIYT